MIIQHPFCAEWIRCFSYLKGDVAIHSSAPPTSAGSNTNRYLKNKNKLCMSEYFIPCSATIIKGKT